MKIKHCKQNYSIQYFSPGIVIVYDGQSYQNNSIVNLDTEGGALQCFTNKSGCCKQSREGEWRYPNGSWVRVRGINADFYRTRGSNPGVINLHWTKKALIPTGLLCCEIHPYYYQLQTACIGVYPPDEGNNTVTIQLDSKTYYNNCVGCVNRHPQGDKHN